jgi:hypothetical protein
MVFIDGLPSIAIERHLIAHAVNNDHVNAWVELFRVEILRIKYTVFPAGIIFPYHQISCTCHGYITIIVAIKIVRPPQEVQRTLLLCRS